MAKVAQLVVPRDGKWAVRRIGSNRARRRFTTKREAIEAAREIARKQRSEVYVFGEDGRIRQRIPCSEDPFQPKG